MNRSTSTSLCSDVFYVVIYVISNGIPVLACWCTAFRRPFCVWGIEALWWRSGNAAGWRGRWFIRADLSWKAWITEGTVTLSQPVARHTHAHTHLTDTTWPLIDPIECFQITQWSQWPHMLDRYSSHTNMITTVHSRKSSGRIFAKENKFFHIFTTIPNNANMNKHVTQHTNE